MLRFSRNAATACHLACLRRVASAGTAPQPPKEEAYVINRKREEHHQRIYYSRYPSVADKVAKYHSLCDFQFSQWETAAPGRVALIQEGTKEQMTYPELRANVERMSAVLYHQYGVRKGDIVCIKMLNHIWYPVAAYAILRLGAIITTTNAVSTPELLASHLEVSKAKVIISSASLHLTVADGVALCRKQTGVEVRALYVEGVPQLAADTPAIPASYTALEEAQPEDVAFLPFSSGTTGMPKGVQLMNKNLYANMIQYNSYVSNINPEKDMFLTILPFFHIFGFVVAMSCGLAAASTQVIMSKYNVMRYIHALEEYKVTCTYIAPPMAISLVHQLEKMPVKPDLSSWDTIFCAAAPLSPDIARRLQACAPNVQLKQGWGMTEMAPTVTSSPRTDTKIGPTCVGALLPDNEMRIVKVDASQQSGADKSAGVDAEEGQEGEVWVRGPNMMKGYLNPEETAIAVQDGWYRTGDLGYVDTEYNGLYISGRLKELIKYKGFQVSPPQIEAELVKHPWVKDCIVVGITDPRDISFETPRGLVVLVDGLTPEEVARAPKEIVDFMAKHLPAEKHLHGGVRIVQEIPKNASGKLMRRDARQMEQNYVKAHGMK